MIKSVILSCLLYTVCAQDLLAVRDTAGFKLWRDRGGTGRKDVTIYEPVKPGPDYYLLGQRAQGNYEKMEREVHSFKDMSRRRDAFSRPAGFTFIWDDRGSSFRDDASVWRPSCQRGYDALGDVLARKNRVSQPPAELFTKFRCVAEDMTAACDIGNKVWDNAGSWGTYYISMWEARPRSGHLPTGFYYAKNQHNDRPNVAPRCLKYSAVRIQ